MMVRFHYPDGDWCYRPLHTVHAIFHDGEGRLVARAEAAPGGGYKEFEISGFDLIGPSKPGAEPLR